MAAPAVLDSLAYVDSATMLLLSLQLQAFEGPTSQESMPHAADPMEATASPDFVDPETANAPVRVRSMRFACSRPALSWG